MSDVAPNRHRRAVATLIVCTLMWSTAGVATRFLDSAAGYEITFWRSLFCAAFMIAFLALSRGGKWLDAITGTGLAGLVCGLMWAVMFTCFMVALTITTVANTLIVMAVSPLLAALLSWAVLGERIAPRTWVAIAVAGIGMFWMVRDGLMTDDGGGGQLAGMLVAAGVPIASAINLVAMKRLQRRVDLIPAVLIGALLSCLATLPFVFPMQASGSDLALLAGLGVFQLAVPCSMMIRAARHLTPQETALLALLEVVFGPLWAWLGAGEAPALATLVGGSLILVALIGNELFGHERFARRTLEP